MKKIIYSIINDNDFGIKIKDDMKLNILRILDMVDDKVVCNISDPIEIKNNKIQTFSFDFFSKENSSFIARYRLSENMKFFRISLLPTFKVPNMIEDYIIIEHSNGLTEYKTKYEYKNNKNYSRNEYYYNDKEITEEEASALFNPKTK